MMQAKRNSHNPLITIDMIVPSNPNFRVDGVFNCGAATYNGEVILLCRVAESVIRSNTSVIEVPIVKETGGKDVLETVSFNRNDTAYDFSDSRNVYRKMPDGQLESAALTSLSHLRVARSKDGVNFTVDNVPSIMPTAREESWGMEDPRITQIGDTYYIDYSSVTADGVGVSLISTKDFQLFERHGIIFMPENKDVAIFPEKIGGMYYAMNRPVPSGIGTPNIWISRSPDLLHWGGHKLLYSVQTEGWESGRVGGGAVPILTEHGWLVIYHAADANDRYCLGAMLLEADNPYKIKSILKAPILQPENDYEKEGFFGGVVFACGAVVHNDDIIIYYGAADDKICRADISLSGLIVELIR